MVPAKSKLIELKINIWWISKYIPVLVQIDIHVQLKDTLEHSKCFLVGLLTETHCSVELKASMKAYESNLKE